MRVQPGASCIARTKLDRPVAPPGQHTSTPAPPMSADADPRQTPSQLHGRTRTSTGAAATETPSSLIVSVHRPEAGRPPIHIRHKPSSPVYSTRLHIDHTHQSGATACGSQRSDLQHPAWTQRHASMRKSRIHLGHKDDSIPRPDDRAAAAVQNTTTARLSPHAQCRTAGPRLQSHGQHPHLAEESS